jgi:Family of unknown function (DUF6295)
MCTYVTFREPVEGSAKGPGGKWAPVSAALVYYDHPVHAMAEHTINIDLAVAGTDPAARVAMELTPASARRLVSAIEAALAVAAD